MACSKVKTLPAFWAKDFDGANENEINPMKIIDATIDPFTLEFCLIFLPENKIYNTGKTISVRIVEEINPPITTVAKGF
jgi:hypothetical protein